MNPWKHINTYKEEFKNYSEKIKQTQASPDTMTELYSFIKKITPIFYINNCLEPSYEYVRAAMTLCELQIPKKFIIESNPNFNLNNNPNIKNCTTTTNILNYIVCKTRQQLSIKHSFEETNPTNLDQLDLVNDCIYSSSTVNTLCEHLNLKSYTLKIHQGYKEDAKLCNGNGFHMFNIIELNNQYHLIDCTYRQFFTLYKNHLDRIGIINTAGCKPGTFMIMNKERKQIATKILKDGWITLEENTLKHFLDGFTISFRNGLYYETTQDFSYTTPYTTEDYINFLQEKDNQINHEGKENLGFQKKPLKNWNLNFKR